MCVCVHVCVWYMFTSISGLLHSSEEREVDGVECHCERTVNDPPIDVRPKINLADIVILQHSVVSSIGGVVSSTVVQRASRGER